MPMRKYYRFNCETDGIFFEYSSGEPPTQCPINPAHTLLDVTLIDNNDSPSTLFEAVVSPSERTGNYTSISEAFQDGLTRLFVRNGMYSETSDIVIPSDGSSLIGESANGVIVQFVGSSRLRAIGTPSGQSQNAGTISVASGSDIITGSQTAFSGVNPAVGAFIQVGADEYEVASVTSDTELQLAKAYNGASRTDVPYKLRTLSSNVEMKNIRLIGGTSNDPVVYLQGQRAFRAERVDVSGGDGGSSPSVIQMVDCCGGSTFVRVSAHRNSAGSGIQLQGCSSITFDNCDMSNNRDHGATADPTSAAVAFQICRFNANGLSGVQSEAADLSISGGRIEANGAHGVVSTIDSNGTVVAQSALHRNGQCGIMLEGSSGVVSDCVIDSNNNDGICVNGDRNLITGNRSSRNGNYGLSVEPGATNTSVGSIQAFLNGASNYENSGSDTAVVTVSGGDGDVPSSADAKPVFSASFNWSRYRPYMETNSSVDTTACIFIITTKITIMRFVASAKSNSTPSCFRLMDESGSQMYGSVSPVLSTTPTAYYMTDIGQGNDNDPFPSPPTGDIVLDLVFSNGGGNDKVRLWSFAVY